MNLLESYDNDYDFLTSSLFDYNSDQFLEYKDYHDLSDIAWKKLNKGQSFNIHEKETCREAMFNDKVSIFILEYEEIKNYMNLFTELYNQEMFKQHRLNDKLQTELLNKENKDEKVKKL